LNANLESEIENQITKIWSFVRAKVPPEDFEDVIQDIKLSYFVAFPSFRGESELETFAYEIAKNRVADYWRSQYRWEKAIKEMGEELPKGAVKLEDDAEKNQKLKRLSKAEKAVFRLLGRGMTNEEMAASLFRSKSTVRTHLKSIYKKFGSRNRARLAVLSFKIFGGEKK